MRGPYRPVEREQMALAGLLPVGIVARDLGVDPSTLWRWRAAGAVRGALGAAGASGRRAARYIDPIAAREYRDRLHGAQRPERADTDRPRPHAPAPVPVATDGDGPTDDEEVPW